MIKLNSKFKMCENFVWLHMVYFQGDLKGRTFKETFSFHKAGTQFLCFEASIALYVFSILNEVVIFKV